MTYYKKLRFIMAALLFAAVLSVFVSCAKPPVPEVSADSSLPVTEQVISSPSETSSVSENGDNTDYPETPDNNGKLIVHFIDVGQGDAIFIELPGGECMLIDCGEKASVNRVITLIDCLGYSKIDYVIATHPHTDHMGGMATVLSLFDVGEVYMPDVTANTETFLGLLNTIDEKGLSINVAESGESITLSGVKAEFLGPVKIYANDLNNCSAVLKIEHGDNSFLFTGDAEKEEEADILAVNSEKLDCDVLKSGHHGSSTSSSASFIAAADPDIAVISCGEGNKYGHPHTETLDSYSKLGITVYRTDLSGTVNIISDGKTMTVEEGTPEFESKWALNISGIKIHTKDCGSVASMAEKNLVYSVRSLAELEKFGFTRCQSCNPTE